MQITIKSLPTELLYQTLFYLDLRAIGEILKCFKDVRNFLKLYPEYKRQLCFHFPIKFQEVSSLSKFLEKEHEKIPKKLPLRVCNFVLKNPFVKITGFRYEEQLHGIITFTFGENKFLEITYNKGEKLKLVYNNIIREEFGFEEDLPHGPVIYTNARNESQCVGFFNFGMYCKFASYHYGLKVYQKKKTEKCLTFTKEGRRCQRHKCIRSKVCNSHHTSRSVASYTSPWRRY